MKCAIRWGIKIGVMILAGDLVQWLHSKLPPAGGKLVLSVTVSLLVAAVWEVVRREIAEVRRQAALAEASAEGLAGLCKVGEYNLPLPGDSRWVFGKKKITYRDTGREEDAAFLSIGDTIAVGRYDIYVNTQCLPEDVATLAYAKRVWRAYHQKSVDKLKEQT